ncbi:MAG: hypothetical protein JWQ78_1864, partial [Sediminibacterium sp.]|nr:hypothetical protein [Sediminibacterium sp.]
MLRSNVSNSAHVCQKKSVYRKRKPNDKLLVPKKGCSNVAVIADPLNSRLSEVTGTSPVRAFMDKVMIA